ncbi:thioesterase [Neisseria arctica]|uniref:Thioesterase n=1 Tax=Neisseria arctica TaxID=1470200 RepID=A0A0J0YSB3_9NEIS|nr:thioesterase family protein [Neisseria arctica]KLT73040.1 thioesterase [Neisseria arctica]UOO86756.1 acyl-CoA thioesterase [Neisseria arctica]
MSKETIIRVRGYHMDGYGHVNNARYLEFLEEARWAYFEQHNLLPLLQGEMMVVARVDIRYRRPSTAGDELRVESRIIGLEPRQVLLQQNIVLTDSGKNVVEAELTLVPVSSETGRATDMNENLFQALQKLTDNQPPV